MGKNKAIDLTPLLNIEGVRKAFDRVRVLSDVSFTSNKGECVRASQDMMVPASRPCLPSLLVYANRRSPQGLREVPILGKRQEELA
jgi:hypothetical protein